MNLRKKTLLTVGTILMAIFIVIGVFSSFFMQDSYRDVEQILTDQDVSRAITSIQNDQSRIYANLRDYSAWNDTYLFAQGVDNNWESINVRESLFELDDTQYILVFNRSNIPVTAVFYNHESRNIGPAPGAFVQEVHDLNTRHDIFSGTDGTIGLVNTSEGLVILASYPVLTDNYKGPAAGAVVMAKKIDNRYCAAISRQIERTVTLVGPSGIPGTALIALTADVPANPVQIIPQGQDSITGITRINDERNSSQYFLQVSGPRTVYTAGLVNIATFLVSLFLGGALITIAVLVFIDNIILSRIGTILEKIHTRLKNDDGSPDTDRQGVDELAELGNAIDPVFTQLADATRLRKESEERFRTIFNMQQIGLMMIDAGSRTIVDVNPYAARTIGLPRDRIVGKACHTFVCPAEAGRCPVGDLGQTVDCSERFIISQANAKIPVIKTVSKTKIDGKEYYIESFFDISERKKAEEALSQANRKLNLLSSITRHDVRNQMTALEGYQQLVAHQT